MTREQMVTEELKTYGAELVPGAAEQLGRRYAIMGRSGPVPCAELVAELVASDVARPYLNPGHIPTPHGPLRTTLERYAGRLREGAVDALEAKLGPSLAGAPPGRMAARVLRALEDRDNHEYLANPPEMPRGERRLYDFVWDHFKDVVCPEGAARFARERGGRATLAHTDDSALLRQVALALSRPEVAARYGGDPIAQDDPRLGGRATRATAKLFSSPAAAVPEARAEQPDSFVNIA